MEKARNALDGHWNIVNNVFDWEPKDFSVISPFPDIEPTPQPPKQTIQEIVDELKERGAFLHGSREKFQNWKTEDTDIDWDWAVDKKELPDHWSLDFDRKLDSTPFGDWLEQNFYYDSSDYGSYEDSNLVAMMRHNDYEHITIQIVHDLEKYKVLWKKLPMWFWKEYLWKSNPDIKDLMANPKNKKAWLKHKQDVFKMLYEMTEVKSIEEYF